MLTVNPSTWVKLAALLEGYKLCLPFFCKSLHLYMDIHLDMDMDMGIDRFCNANRFSFVDRF
jgi:hypothetical protein